MKKNLTKTFLFAALAPLLLVGNAMSATINWSPTATSYDGNSNQVDLTGSLVTALTIYGTSSSTLLVNTVTFKNYLSADNVSFSLYDLPQVGGSTSGSNYETLLSTGSYVADGSASGPYGPTFLNLTVGHVYEIQAWTPFGARTSIAPV